MHDLVSRARRHAQTAMRPAKGPAWQRDVHAPCSNLYILAWHAMIGLGLAHCAPIMAGRGQALMPGKALGLRPEAAGFYYLLK
jgi:hypothetical protein